MHHHLDKAREIYVSEGPLGVIKSMCRYIPIEINNFIFSLQHGIGTQVMNEDWDNLLILDACRYDMFADRINMEGSLESRISLGSSSEEFMERNFVGKQFHDTVYINANPFIPKLDLDDSTFHAVIDCLKKWDEELETIRPATVAQAASDAHRRYPNKRLIVHFMQPHAPFIGKRGQKMIGGGWTMDHDVDAEPGVWNQLRDGQDVSLETVWEAYNENLELVLAEVEPLVNELNGKSVITSDHGNLVGERLGPIPTRQKYGHPYGVHTEELVKVPWFVIEGRTRRKVSSEPPAQSNSDTIPEAELKDRLGALGYR